jgi:hypothetical protein
VVRLPAIPVGPADLLRLRLAAAPGVLAEMVVEVGDGPVSASVASGWRDADPAGAIGLDLPLPAGPMASVTLRLRNTGAARATVEVASLALASAAAGAPREAPPAALARLPPRGGVVLPDSAAIPAATQAPWHNAPPAPRLAAADPGGAVPAAPVPASAPRSAAGFQDVRLHQHLVNAEGTYRHLDVSVTGLVAGGGLWRQVRLKLFERRGTTGLEFREANGLAADV